MVMIIKVSSYRSKFWSDEGKVALHVVDVNGLLPGSTQGTYERRKTN